TVPPRGNLFSWRRSSWRNTTLPTVRNLFWKQRKFMKRGEFFFETDCRSRYWKLHNGSMCGKCGRGRIVPFPCQRFPRYYRYQGNTSQCPRDPGGAGGCDVQYSSAVKRP